MLWGLWLATGILCPTAQWCSGCTCANRRLIELEAESVGQTREVIEDADDVRGFHAGAVVEAEVAQRQPIVFCDVRGLGAEFLRDRAKGAIAVG